MDTRQMSVVRAMEIIASHGHVVTKQDIPGLYRIDGGQEITTNQLISIATSYVPSDRFMNSLLQP